LIRLSRSLSLHTKISPKHSFKRHLKCHKLLHLTNYLKVPYIILYSLGSSKVSVNVLLMRCASPKVGVSQRKSDSDCPSVLTEFFTFRYSVSLLVFNFQFYQLLWFCFVCVATIPCHTRYDNYQDFDFLHSPQNIIWCKLYFSNIIDHGGRLVSFESSAWE
jgi:hypothetical protein